MDWWTVGVLIFEMTAGNVPFYSKDQQHMYRKIVQGNLYLPSHFTPELKDLCQNILQVYIKSDKRIIEINATLAQ